MSTMKLKPRKREDLVTQAARSGTNDFGNGIDDITPRVITLENVVKSMESRVVSEGPLAGQSFVCMGWQQEMVGALIHYGEVLLSCARGNGKTAFFANLACEWLDGVFSWPRTQINLVASSLDQARVCFTHVKYFLGQERLDFERYTPEPTEGNAKPRSTKRWRVSDNAHQCRLEDRKTGIVLLCMGSDSKRAHGRAPTVVLADEPAQWAKGGRKLFNAMIGGLGKQARGKIFVFGTLPEDDQHWFVKRIKRENKNRKCFLYQATDDGEDPFDEQQWRNANPSYDHLAPLRVEIANKALDAEEDEEDLASFKAYQLNLGVEELVTREALISIQDWRACIVPHDKFDAMHGREGPVVLTIDLGGGTSMSAGAAYFPETGRTEAYGAFPAQPDLKKRGLADAVGTRYLRMKADGELWIYPGISTNNGLFLADFFKKFEGREILTIVADRYKETDTKQAILLSGLVLRQEVEWRAVGKGKEGSYDVRAFRQEVMEGHMKSRASLLIEQSIADGIVARDTNGNEALDKSRKKGRIDVAQCLVMAAGAGRRHRQPEGDDMETQNMVRYYEEALAGKTPLIDSI